jgi:hypothetical protein
MLRRLAALISTLFLLNVSIVQFVSPCETHEGESGSNAHPEHAPSGVSAAHSGHENSGNGRSSHNHNGHNHSVHSQIDNVPQGSTPELPACCLALTSCVVTLTTCAPAGRSGNDLDNTRVFAPGAERENSWVTQVEPPPPKI